MTVQVNALVRIRPRNAEHVVYEGKVVKYQPCEVLENNGVVWIEDVAGTQYKFFEGFDEIEVVEEALAVNAFELDRYMYQNKDSFRAVDGYDDAYYIEGLTYTIVVGAIEEGFALETIHNERKQIERDDIYADSLEMATANARIVKTLRGVKGYLDRYAD